MSTSMDVTSGLNTTQDSAPKILAEDLVAGLVPAFQHARTGETHLARSRDGSVAPLHTFIGLPDEWIAERDVDGYALALHPDVLAGYWHCARFVSVDELLVQTREQLI